MEQIVYTLGYTMMGLAFIAGIVALLYALASLVMLIKRETWKD